jgi:F0F1-type ATP synthase membrane subunit c/vacuolar-type H+-ATPase subunit K
MKAWVVRFVSLYVFNVVVLLLIGLLTPAHGWAAIWASVVLTLAELFVKLLQGAFAKSAAKTAGERTRAGEALVQGLIVLAVAAIVWIITLLLTGERTRQLVLGVRPAPDHHRDRLVRVFEDRRSAAAARRRPVRPRRGAHSGHESPRDDGRYGIHRHRPGALLDDGLTPEQRKMLDDPARADTTRPHDDPVTNRRPPPEAASSAAMMDAAASVHSIRRAALPHPEGSRHVASRSAHHSPLPRPPPLLLAGCAGGLRPGVSTAGADAGYVTPGKLTFATGETAYEPYVLNDDPASGEGFEAPSRTPSRRSSASRRRTSCGCAPRSSRRSRRGRRTSTSTSSSTRSPTSAQAVDFSTPYYEASQSVVAVKGGKADGVTDIAGPKVSSSAR